MAVTLWPLFIAARTWVRDAGSTGKLQYPFKAAEAGENPTEGANLLKPQAVPLRGHGRSGLFDRTIRHTRQPARDSSVFAPLELDSRISCNTERHFSTTPEKLAVRDIGAGKCHGKG